MRYLILLLLAVAIAAASYILGPYHIWLVERLGPTISAVLLGSIPVLYFVPGPPPPPQLTVMPAQPPAADETLTHIEEYKTLCADVKLYQEEIHRTWMWAFTAAAAIYAAFVLKGSDPKNLLHIPKEVSWLLPALFGACCLRYFIFIKRIDKICDYIILLETRAFGADQALPGVNHFVRGPLKYFTKGCKVGALLVWILFIALSSYPMYLSFSHEPIAGTPATSTTNAPANPAPPPSK